MSEKVLIESLSFANINNARHLKAKSVPIEEWNREMANIGCPVYEAILMGEIISKNHKKRPKWQMISLWYAKSFAKRL